MQGSDAHRAESGSTNDEEGVAARSVREQAIDFDFDHGVALAQRFPIPTVRRFRYGVLHEVLRRLPVFFPVEPVHDAMHDRREDQTRRDEEYQTRV